MTISKLFILYSYFYLSILLYYFFETMDRL